MLLGEANNEDSEESEEMFANIPNDEVQLIEEFLDKFVFSTDTSVSREDIDLNLALKALPNKVDESNIYRIDLISFKII